jgi:hypothetical protein
MGENIRRSMLDGRVVVCWVMNGAINNISTIYTTNDEEN